MQRTPGRHIILDSGYVLKSDAHHQIWLPLSFCKGVVMHREGKPGVVVAHRADLYRGAIREKPTPMQIESLNRGVPVRVEGRMHHPDDLVAFMREGMPKAEGELRLTVFARPDVSEEGVREHMIPAFAEAQKAGWLKHVEFKGLGPTELPYVDATTGRVHIATIDKVPLKKLTFERKNEEWTE